MSHCQHACTQVPYLIAGQQVSQTFLECTASHVHSLHASHTILSWLEGLAHAYVTEVLGIRLSPGACSALCIATAASDVTTNRHICVNLTRRESRGAPLCPEPPELLRQLGRPQRLLQRPGRLQHGHAPLIHHFVPLAILRLPLGRLRALRRLLPRQGAGVLLLCTSTLPCFPVLGRVRS